MLVMGGTRTSHRLACAIEDCGFIIKDTLMWLYGSGFPKAQDLGKMIDKRAGKKREKGKLKFKGGTQLGVMNDDGWKPKDVHESMPNTDLAKHWDGFKVGGIKPAYESIIWAVRPPEGSYVDNVLKHGVGAVNVAETRIGTEKIGVHGYPGQGNFGVGGKASYSSREGSENTPPIYMENKGRFPANIILSHHPECVQVGMKRVKGQKAGTGGGFKSDKYSGTMGRGKYTKDKFEGRADKDGLETVESWQCHPDCAVRLLDEQSGDKRGAHGGNNCGYDWIKGGNVGKKINRSDSGGASRFYYCAKSSRAERNAGLDDLMIEGQRQIGIDKKGGKAGDLTCRGNTNPICQICGGSRIDRGNGICDCKEPQWEAVNLAQQNTHPTCKPISLFEYLIKLVTRQGQVVLDPFLGSGTTAIAAHNVGRKCIGIEKEEEYIEIAKARIRYWKKRGRQLRLL